MKRSLLLLPALLATLSRSPGSSCGCGGGSSSNGTVTGSLNIIYTSATTNIGTSPGTGVRLLTIEQPVTVSTDKPQGGSGLFALLTDPVSGSRPTTSSPLKTFVKGGSGSPIQYGNLDASLQMEASSTDVYHPVEVTYENDTADYREHMLITPPSGHYLLSSLVAKETGGGWTQYPNQVIQDPEKSGSEATFLRMVFVSERGDAHHEPGDFTFPVMAQEENFSGGNTLGDVTSAFTVWLGNDQASGGKQGRSWGRLVARPGLLSDVGAHQFRFVTAHSPVDTGSPVLVDEIIAATGRTYQIKTAAILLDVREVVLSDNGTPTNYADDRRKVTIRLTTHADAGTPDGNGVYPEPATPKYGSLVFEQTERASNGFTFKTIFRQFAPGANPASANPIAAYEYSAAELTANTHRRLTTSRASLETEVAENFIFMSGSAFGTSNPVRMETRHTHLGATSAGALLSTSRAMVDITSRGENLIRTESGSTNGSALDDDGWAASECLEWTTHTWHTSSGTRFLTENSRGQWSQQFFYQDRSFIGTVPSHYGTLAEGDRYSVSVLPEKLQTDTLATHLSTGHARVSRLTQVTASSDSSSKVLASVMSEERNKGRLVELATTATSMVGSGTASLLRYETTTRRDPNAGTPTTELSKQDTHVFDNTDVQKRGRVSIAEGPEATKHRREISNPAEKKIRYTEWTEPSSGTLTTLDSASDTDPAGRPVTATTKVVSVTAGTSTTTELGTATTTTTAYSNDGTNPAIRITTTTRDSIQISQEKYDPGLRLRTGISAEGVTTETYYDALGRPTSSARLTAVGIAGTATYYDYEARTGGGRIQRVRQGTAAGTILASEQASDNAGRSVAGKDGAGLITTYAYSINGSGQAVTTETLPSGGTRITTVGVDGETVSVTGTAVVAREFSTAIVGQTGDTVTPPSWITTAQSLTDLRRRSVKTGSARWQHTVTDGAGRTVATWGGGSEELSVYNAGGQLLRIEYGPAVVSSTNTVRAPLRYEYDSLGRTVKTGYSLDGNAVLDAGSASDRVSLTAYSIVQIGGAGPWWNKTERKFYTDANGTTATAATSLELLKPDSATGLLSETRTTTGDGAEQRTQTTINTTTLERKTLTTTPGSATNTATTIYKNGILSSSTTLSVQTPVIYYYDTYGRSTGQSDPQTSRATVTEYNAQGQVARTADLAGNNTFYEYHATGTGAGQLKKVTHQDGAYTSYEYDLHGRVTAQTGSADYPVRYTYDATYGWMTEMKTYRDTTGDDALNGTAGNASLTTWAYDAATGLLTSKTDAASKATSYTYWTGTTFLKERLWARFVTGTTRVTTTYNYDAAGQLASTTYNDSTPTVTRTYDRAGREAMRSDGVGDTTFTRTAGGFVTSEAGDADILYGWTLNRTVDAYGRYSGVDGVWSYAGISANNGILTAAYAYNAATGRLDSVTNNSRPVALTYTANSDQPAKRQFKDDASNILFEQEYDYDEAGRLNMALTRDVSPATIHAAYYYQYDSRNRRTQAVREDGVQWNYGYDQRGQVTSAKMKTGADYLAGRQYEYAYDAIGNRLTAKSGGDTAGANLRTAGYTRNNLNQYTAVSNPLTFDVNGTATNTATDTNAITVAIGTGTYESPDAIQPGTNGVTARWHRQKTATSADNSKPTWETVNVKENTTLKSNGPVRLPPVNQAPTYDHDGNLLTDGTWTYTWDAENRLLAAEQAALPQGTGAPSARLRVTFIYDGLGRRIFKTTDSNGGGGWATLSTQIWVYDGWNVVLRAAVAGGAVTWEQAYVWGPDMSGTRQGAGGVGGLLIENKNLGSGEVARRLVGYDSNGNVTTLADGTNGNLWALYEYDAFGNETRHHNAVGTHADDNPFRFSTKMTDDEAGLVYYGYRYYSPGLGRWIGRDPIGEIGGTKPTLRIEERIS